MNGVNLNNLLSKYVACIGSYIVKIGKLLQCLLSEICYSVNKCLQSLSLGHENSQRNTE